MKEAFYFQHDYNARNDPKMVDLMCSHGMTGIGVFWCIIEQLYQSGGKLPIANYKSIAFALHVECTLVASVVQDFGLFQNDGVVFWSESAMKRMAKKKEISEKRKQASNARWNNANAMQMDSNCNSGAISTQNPPIENHVSEGGNLPENGGFETNCNANAIQLDNKTDANAMQKNAIKDKRIKDNTEDITVREKRSVFTPPTLEEVQNYVSEKGYSMDAVKFWNFYESKGWMVGKNKMKKWKAAVANWASSERPQHQSPASSGRGHDGIKHCNDEWA